MIVCLTAIVSRRLSRALDRLGDALLLLVALIFGRGFRFPD
jgi:hypothetical protein